MRWNFSFCLLMLLWTASFTDAQQYSFSVFAFSIFDGDSIVQKLSHVTGYGREYRPDAYIDSTSQFAIRAEFPDEDIDFHRFAMHKKGVFLLYAENVKKHRPIRYFCIEKTDSHGIKRLMKLILNYNYHSCEMPCSFEQGNFQVSQICFREGNFLLTGIMNKVDWNTNSEKFIETKENIQDYIGRTKLIFWDLKMKK